MSNKKWSRTLESLENIIFDLNETNVDDSVEATIKLLGDNFSNCLNMTIVRLIYSSFLSQMKDFDIYFDFMKKLEIKKRNKNNSEIINSFSNFLLDLKTQESYYLLERLINLNVISSNLIDNTKNLYFAHEIPSESISAVMFNRIRFSKYFSKNFNELSKNDWELHKKYVKEGHNPSEIAKILRNDEIEKLQEISSQNDFGFNQTIKPSLYERCSFVNDYLSLIDYAAFFGSIKCFKYLLMNGANIEDTGKYAIAGGNLEIVHLCEQNHCSFYLGYEAAIKYHRNDIFYYLYENEIIDHSNKQLFEIILSSSNDFINIKILNFLLEKEELNIGYV